MRARISGLFFNIVVLAAATAACGRGPDATPSPAPAPSSGAIAPAKARAAIEAAPTPIDTQTAPVRVAIDGLPVLGDSHALVTIVEFTDYQCPYCKRADDVVGSLREAYGADVRIVLANHPLPMHDHARPAALAVIAAAEQGKAGPMGQRLFAHGKQLDDDALRACAAEAGLDLVAFEASRHATATAASLDRAEALATSLGVKGTPTFFVNGRRVVGAQPLATFKQVVDEELAKARSLVAGGVREEDVYATIQERAAEPSSAGSVAEQARDCAGGDGGCGGGCADHKGSEAANDGREEPKVEVAIDNAPMRGPSSAPVTVVMFTDFECPFCARAAATVADLEREYPTQVRIALRNRPLPMHEHAELAAKAALAAGAQGKLWEYHDALFAHQGALDRAALDGYARTLGLDVARFDRDLESPEVEARIGADDAQATALHVEGTPTFFVNGRRVVGAQDLGTFKAAVERALTEPH